MMVLDLEAVGPRAREELSALLVELHAATFEQCASPDRYDSTVGAVAEWVQSHADPKSVADARAAMIRHFIETPDGDREIEPVTFCHAGGGPHRSCDACLAVVERDGRLVHAAGCGAAKVSPRRGTVGP